MSFEIAWKVKNTRKNAGVEDWYPRDSHKVDKCTVRFLPPAQNNK